MIIDDVVFMIPVCVCAVGTKRPRGRPRKEGSVMAVRPRRTGGCGSKLSCYSSDEAAVAVFF